MMDWLEQELKEALARKAPPPEFAARVCAKARRRPMVSMRRWLASAAALLVIGGSGLAWRHRQGVAAKDRVMLAVRITADKLNHIQKRVREVNP